MKFTAAGVIAVFILYTGYKTEHSKRKAAAVLEEFVSLILFAAQEIAARGTMLEELFEKAGKFYGSTYNGSGGCVRLFSGEVVRNMQSDMGFAAAWEDAVRKVYGKTGLLADEMDLLAHLWESFLLPDRETVKIQLSLDAKRLGEKCTFRRQKIESDCRLCRILSFALAAFLMILVW